MIWQDYVFTVGSLFFTVTLIPTAIDKRTAMPRYKSAPTAFWLVVFAVAHWTLGMRIAPVCEVVCAACWAFIAWKRAPAPEIPTLEVTCSPGEFLEFIKDGVRFK